MLPKDTKILLIEDDPRLIDIYLTKFEHEGYNYKHAGDGEAGILEAKAFRPDIILSDIILPKKDGFAVLKSLKEDSETKDIPVILLTNLGQEDDVKKGMELGAVNYLIKTNCTPAQVVDEIQKVLGEKKVEFNIVE